MTILRTLLVTLSTSVQDEDTVTMTMVTIVDSDGITTAFSAFLPRLARNLLQGVTLSSHCSGELCRPGLVAAALQCDARGSHSVCYNLQYLLHSTAATDGGCSMAPLVAGCLAGLFMLPRVTIHNQARHHCPAHRDKHRWRLEASVNGKLTGGSSIELLNRL